MLLCPGYRVPLLENSLRIDVGLEIADVFVWKDPSYIRTERKNVDLEASLNPRKYSGYLTIEWILN